MTTRAAHIWATRVVLRANAGLLQARVHWLRLIVPVPAIDRTRQASEPWKVSTSSAYCRGPGRRMPRLRNHPALPLQSMAGQTALHQVHSLGSLFDRLVGQLRKAPDLPSGPALSTESSAPRRGRPFDLASRTHWLLRYPALPLQSSSDRTPMYPALSHTPVRPVLMGSALHSVVSLMGWVIGQANQAFDLPFRRRLGRLLQAPGPWFHRVLGRRHPEPAPLRDLTPCFAPGQA